MAAEGAARTKDPLSQSAALKGLAEEPQSSRTAQESHVKLEKSCLRLLPHLFRLHHIALKQPLSRASPQAEWVVRAPLEELSHIE